jgi:hypothetical protein
MNVCRYNGANSLPASTWEPASTLEIMRRVGRRGPILPMTPTATPISATTEQQQQNNNDENQVHSKSPLRSRLQMEGTDPGELSSPRLEFHYRPSSLPAVFVTALAKAHERGRHPRRPYSGLPSKRTILRSSRGANRGAPCPHREAGDGRHERSSDHK